MAKNINLVAKKYAEALVELEASDKTLSELKLIKKSLEDCPEFKSSLENPSINNETKETILKEILSSKVSQNCLNLVNLCVNRRRIAIIPLLAEHYEKAYFNKSNIELAKIESPQKLSSAEIEELKKQLESAFKKEVKIESSTNEELIAGIKINMNNKLIDYSLKSKIKKLKQNIK